MRQNDPNTGFILPTGPDKETFIALHEEANGKIQAFNKALVALGQEPMSERTFRRRRVQWIEGLRSNRKPDLRREELEARLQADTRPVAGGTIDPPDKRRLTLAGERFVFTSAQNNTFVHEAFFKNLLSYCQHRGAQLVVGKFRYNKSGFQNATAEGDEDLWYDPKVIPYVIEHSARLDSSPTGTVWCGELDILPTAATPLSGLENYTHTASSIIPHAKVQMQSIPVMKGMPKKKLFTTGAVTQRNYIQRKAGQKAEFHHVFGALLVEFDVEGREFHRQLIADSTGAFYDLTELYKDGEVYGGQTVEAINWGDIHAECIDDAVAQVSWRRAGGSMLDELKPRFQFIHDLTDFRARNHHNIKNPHFLAERHFTKSGSVLGGMQTSVEVLEDMYREWCTLVIVESNHDQAFRRWLSEADIRTDPENAEYFHRANAELFKNIRMGHASFHVFEWALRELSPLKNTIFLNEDDSFVVCGNENGIECGSHGHRGPNGSRGNPNSLRRLGRKYNVGHTHSPGIIDGIFTSGISCKEDLGYNHGPSSWSATHIVTYRNGKRTLVTIERGKYKA